MFDIGFMELLVVGVLGLLVLGPERLPKAARTLGLIIGRVRRSMSNLQEDLERHARTEELKAKLRDPAATFLDDDILNPASLRKSDSESTPAEKPPVEDKKE
ncbi:Sec-independent protein translocase protein TatB [uncultured Thalassolituus sp.]|uniref:Sec-independent protein translocase protein TatB n=1 Tax=uncultured Thalassolituus sp. TaxID=285273 RepID=UPI0026159EF5|nr:Sec-independent protein translocase protein TatB [uncultured Thalassolituus sp.]